MHKRKDSALTTNLSINKLKELVTTAKDLDLVITYFFDLLDAKLLAASPAEEPESPELKAVLNIINEVISNHFKLETKIIDTMLQQTAAQYLSLLKS